MNFEIRSENGFDYVEVGTGKPLLLLHGLFGALSNFQDTATAFVGTHRVLIPLMPIYAKSDTKATVSGLTDFISQFIEYKQLTDITLLGNSLGGHIALVYTLRHPEKINALILTGSSGLFESGMGSSFPKRGSKEYVQERVAYTFYSPETASEELITEVYHIVNDNYSALRILQFARSAQNHNMRDEIFGITCPTLLIWGLNDNITPPYVAHEFDRLLPNATLRFIDKCGHAPMMEQPEIFNKLATEFLATAL
jgi:pimeloyl-ACP methyl ester carboxylesterase